MFRKILKSLILMIGIGFVANAYAVGEGFMIGAQGGATDSHNISELAYTGSTFVTVTPKNKGFALRLYGGYQATYGGFEMGFTYFSTTKYDASGGSSIEPTSRLKVVDILGEGIWPFYNIFSIYGKAGLAGVLRKQSPSLIEGSGEKRTRGFVRPEVAVGASVDITTNIVADLSWTRIISRGALRSIDFMALGVSYHFVDVYCGQFLC